MALEIPARIVDTYVLGRDFKSASRLNYQQYLWYGTLQYNIHPSITKSLPLSTSSNDQNDDVPSTPIVTPAPLSELPLKIADIACGSGAWLRSLAQTFPQAQLHGYDISLAQCPPTQWLSPNIHLHEWNIFDEPSADMLGCYDVVHTRLIFTVIRNGEEDVRTIVRNLTRMLKPGGFLQWDELDVERSFVRRVDEGISAPVMEGMVSGLGKVGAWVGGLAERMEEGGLIEATRWNVEERLDLARAFFDCNLEKDDEMAANALKGTEEGKRLARLVGELFEESKAGVVICTPKIVCTARKPARGTRW